MTNSILRGCNRFQRLLDFTAYQHNWKPQDQKSAVLDFLNDLALDGFPKLPAQFKAFLKQRAAELNAQRASGGSLDGEPRRQNILAAAPAADLDMAEDGFFEDEDDDDEMDDDDLEAGEDDDDFEDSDIEEEEDDDAVFAGDKSVQ